MREYLLQFMNEDAAMGVQFLIALIAVLILFGIFVWFLRLITGTQNKSRPARPDQRLAVLDRTSVDDSRSLLLIQRDGVEHLLMVGGPSDVVVESNITLGGSSNSVEIQSKSGHEIARRVIAQRPFRTMSLAGSSAAVAESMGIVTTEAPDAAIAASAVPSAIQEPAILQNEVISAIPADTPAVQEPTVAPAPLPVSDVAVKKIAAIISEPPQIESPAQISAVTEPSTQPIEPSIAAVPPTPEPRLVAEPIAATRAPTVEQTMAQQVELHQPAPQIRVQVEPQAPSYSNLADQDILANLEDALKIDVPPTNAASHKMRAQPAQSVVSESTRSDLAPEQNHISTRQDIDLESGFAAAMANAPSEQQFADTGPTISENFLEDALANALDVPHDTYVDEKSTVYSSSESAPTGSEGRSALRRTSHVDDEMNRLLDELATPNRG